MREGRRGFVGFMIVAPVMEDIRNKIVGRVEPWGILFGEKWIDLCIGLYFFQSIHIVYVVNSSSLDIIRTVWTLKLLFAVTKFEM